MGYEKSIKAMEIAEDLMPGGVNSPVRAFKSVDTPAILWIMQKVRKYMILTVMNTLIMF